MKGILVDAGATLLLAALTLTVVYIVIKGLPHRTCTDTYIVLDNGWYSDSRRPDEEHECTTLQTTDPHVVVYRCTCPVEAP